MADLGNKHVLVTGGGGFVGAPTVRALLAEGARVRVLDAVEPWRLEGVDCEVVIGDIADPDTVARRARASSSSCTSRCCPLNLANADPARRSRPTCAARSTCSTPPARAGVSRVVYSSASSAYGPTDAYPIVEDQPLRPNAFYPASKAAARCCCAASPGTYGYSFIDPALHERLRPGPDAPGSCPRWRAHCSPASAPARPATAPRRSTSCTSRTARRRTCSRSPPTVGGRGAQRRLGRGDLAERAGRDPRQTCWAATSAGVRRTGRRPRRRASASIERAARADRLPAAASRCATASTDVLEELRAGRTGAEPDVRHRRSAAVTTARRSIARRCSGAARSIAHRGPDDEGVSPRRTGRARPPPAVDHRPDATPAISR